MRRKDTETFETRETTRKLRIRKSEAQVPCRCRVGGRPPKILGWMVLGACSHDCALPEWRLAFGGPLGTGRKAVCNSRLVGQRI